MWFVWCLVFRVGLHRFPPGFVSNLTASLCIASRETRFREICYTRMKLTPRWWKNSHAKTQRRKDRIEKTVSLTKPAREPKAGSKLSVQKSISTQYLEARLFLPLRLCVLACDFFRFGVLAWPAALPRFKEIDQTIENCV